MGKLLEQVREELREYVIPAEVLERPASPPREDFFNLQVDEEAPAEEAEAAVAAVAPPVAAPIAEEQTGGAPEEERVIILTSDQKVLLISLRKEKVIGSLQTLMKTVAVDCQLNFADNNDGTFRCLALGNSVDDFAYNPDLQKDITETEAKFKVEPTMAIAPAPAPVAVAVPSAAMPVAAPVPSAPAPVVEPVAPPSAPVAAPAAAPEPPKPKPKRIVYGGKEYFFKTDGGPNGKPTRYILFAKTDPDNTTPVGYIAADPVKGLPKGPVLPV
jgi:hypothetical protein